MIRILNLEDTATKHAAIARVISKAIPSTIDRAKTLEDGLKMIEAAYETGNPYELLVTDMWYPEYAGGGDAASGEKLIAICKERGWNIPIIIVSSVRYSANDVLAAIHYSENSDWETDLRNALKFTIVQLECSTL